LGVPGPREAWRKLEDVGGMEKLGLRRRPLEGSEEGDLVATRGLRSDDVIGVEAEMAPPAAAEVLRWEGMVETLRGEGEGCRLECARGGCVRRVDGLPVATEVEGPALPESGCRGVDAPAVLVERGGGRVERVEVLRRDGSSGSMEMAPSFWRSRILISRRRI
jgi:hypothetical protein